MEISINVLKREKTDGIKLYEVDWGKLTMKIDNRSNMFFYLDSIFLFKVDCREMERVVRAFDI